MNDDKNIPTHFLKLTVHDQVTVGKGGLSMFVRI